MEMAEKSIGTRILSIDNNSVSLYCLAERLRSLTNPRNCFPAIVPGILTGLNAHQQPRYSATPDFVATWESQWLTTKASASEDGALASDDRFGCAVEAESRCLRRSVQVQPLPVGS